MIQQHTSSQGIYFGVVQGHPWSGPAPYWIYFLIQSHHSHLSTCGCWSKIRLYIFYCADEVAFMMSLRFGQNIFRAYCLSHDLFSTHSCHHFTEDIQIKDVEEWNLINILSTWLKFGSLAHDRPWQTLYPSAKFLTQFRQKWMDFMWPVDHVACLFVRIEIFCVSTGPLLLHYV